MGKHFKRLLAACVVLAGTAGAAAAEPANAPGAAGAAPAADSAASTQCGLTATTSLAVEPPVDRVQPKNWQPRGGEFDIAVTAPRDLSGALVVACFRWRADEAQWIKGEVIRVQSENGLARVTTAVPKRLEAPPEGVTRHIWVVPIADVKILFLGAGNAVTAMATATIGVTNAVFAAIGTLVIVGAMFFVLRLFLRSRATNVDVNKSNPVLAMIATKGGYASLSQFQVLLWTFVIAAAAIYVMLVSGALIALTTGTLVLLGISGAAAVAAQAQATSKATSEQRAIADLEADLEKARLALGKAAGDAAAAAKAVADAETALAANVTDPALIAAKKKVEETLVQKTSAADQAQKTFDDVGAKLTVARAKAEPVADNPAVGAAARTPLWSDLIVTDSNGKVEVDVTRLQMAVFTVIGAAFVLLTAVTTYVIPEIPSGFEILLGISNALYVGNKIVR